MTVGGQLHAATERRLSGAAGQDAQQLVTMDVGHDGADTPHSLTFRMVSVAGHLGQSATPARCREPELQPLAMTILPKQ